MNIFKDHLPICRISNALHRCGIAPISTAMTYFVSFCMSAYFPHQASIDTGTKPGYVGLGVVIHRSARIGRNCVICQHVTIRGTATKKGVPSIGDNVKIGAGPVIPGPIYLGDSSIIGANFVFIKDVAPSTTVGGIPARALSTNRLHHDYD